MRNYTVTLTTGSEQSDRTPKPVWFQIRGNDTTKWTEWFVKSDGFNIKDTTFKFWRVVTDVGDAEKLRILMRINNNLGIAAAGVDLDVLTFPYVIDIVYWEGM